MTGPALIVLGVVCAVLLGMVVLFAWITSSLAKDVSAAEGHNLRLQNDLNRAELDLQKWKEIADRRIRENFDIIKELHELRCALYLYDEEAHQATHQQTVDRAKMLVGCESAVGRLQSLCDKKVIENNEHTKQKLKLELAVLGSEVLSSFEDSIRIATEHREKAAKFDRLFQAAICGLAPDSRKRIAAEGSVDEVCACIHSWRENAMKWEESNGVDVSLVINAGDMVRQLPCGRVFPENMICNCEDCCESRKNLKVPELHNGPDHSETLAPVMGCGDVSKDDFHRSAAVSSLLGPSLSVELANYRRPGFCGLASKEEFERSGKDLSVDFAAGPHRLISTADSIENAPAELPTPVEAFERSIRSSQSLPADFGIDRVLASAEQRSNCYG